MAEGTKERILETALELFAQNGYLGTSMNDIAARLGITKAALYKHYAGKQEILKRIVERMDQMDKERAEAYDFSDPYAYIRTAIIVNGDNNDINSFKDLDGKTTANTLASTYATLAESYGATATGVDDLNQTIELLLAGRVDATLNAEVTYYDYMNQHPDANLKIAALTDEASLVCIPTRKGDDSASLREAINQAIAELSESGQLSELSEKYFGSDISHE